MYLFEPVLSTGYEPEFFRLFYVGTFRYKGGHSLTLGVI